MFEKVGLKMKMSGEDGGCGYIITAMIIMTNATGEELRESIIVSPLCMYR